jgi:hypothetical protein
VFPNANTTPVVLPTPCHRLKTERSTILTITQNNRPLPSGLSAPTCIREYLLRSSVGQLKKGGRGAVGDDPQFVARRGAVAAQKTEAPLRAEMIFGPVFHGAFAPIAVTWRARNTAVFCPVFSRAARAPTVATRRPRSNKGLDVRASWTLMTSRLSIKARKNSCARWQERVRN